MLNIFLFFVKDFLYMKNLRLCLQKEICLELFTISDTTVGSYYMPFIIDMRETFACSRLSRNVFAYTSPARTVGQFVAINGTGARATRAI